MKKLLVFLSIFAVLFVSTIRPLQAEYLEDDFTLVNGNTYYLIYTQTEIPLGSSSTLAYSESGSVQCNIIFNCITFDNCSLDISYQLPNSSSQRFDVDLHYYGTIDEYFGVDGSNQSASYVYSFVWPAPSVSNLIYDDYVFSFDTENPMPPISIYDTIYSLVNKYVFGNNIESGSHQDLTATILSTTICVLVFALPFLIIWKVIKIIMG